MTVHTHIVFVLFAGFNHTPLIRAHMTYDTNNIDVYNLSGLFIVLHFSIYLARIVYCLRSFS